MKRIICTFLLSAALCTASFAQRFQVGIRAGANVADYALPILSTDEGSLRNGKNKMGFEASLLARLSITKHLNLQTEFEYDRLHYGFTFVQDSYAKELKLNVNRIEIPLLLGIHLGPLRLFGGASFRISHNEKSSMPSLMQLKFNDSKVALTGGVGINIRKFFLEGRVTGYPKASSAVVKLQDTERSVIPRRDIKWSFSAGFLF